MQRLTDEMRQAIREASASESCASIAKRLGMKEATVWWHRDKYPTRRRARSRSVKGMDAGAQLVEGSVQ
jgi:DNA-binding CsgD family transcriptional regulator